MSWTVCFCTFVVLVSGYFMFSSNIQQRFLATSCNILSHYVVHFGHYNLIAVSQKKVFLAKFN